jgi:hypothetical protein
MMIIHRKPIKRTTLMNCTPIVRQHLTIGGAVFLTKYSIDEKTNAVLEYLEGKKSYKSIAQERNVGLLAVAELNYQT